MIETNARKHGAETLADARNRTRGLRRRRRESGRRRESDGVRKHGVAVNVAPAILKRYPERAGSRRAVVGLPEDGLFLNRWKTPPEAATRRECDLRPLCRAESVIGEIGESEALAA